MAVVSLLSLLTVLPLLIFGAPLTKRDTPSYASSVSGHIPFYNSQGSWDFSQEPSIAYKLENTDDGHVYRPLLDTGSTGILLGSALYPDNTSIPTDTPGYEYLSSSRRLYNGYWVPRDIYFQGGDNVVSNVPVLVVTKQVICNDYNISNPGKCNSVKTEVCGTPSTQTCQTSYFGVGFGRQKDKTSQSTPDKNAFINVQSINGAAVPSDFDQGYTITTSGIEVGITAANSANFNFIKLNPNPFGGWASVPGCLQVTGPGGSGSNSTCTPSTFLMDTGIPYSFLTATPAMSITGWKTSSVTGNKYQTLPTGYSVTANYGSAPYVTSFSFTTGSSDVDQPSYVSASLDETAGDLAYLNTGLYFYKTHDILFDAGQGYYGIRSSQ